MSSKDKVYEAVSNIPHGCVATYGQIAVLAGMKNPRIVGTILHNNPDPDSTPCYKVVNSKGKLAVSYAFGGIHRQKKQLQRDGVVVAGYAVDLKKYLWKTC